MVKFEGDFPHHLVLNNPRACGLRGSEVPVSPHPLPQASPSPALASVSRRPGDGRSL